MVVKNKKEKQKLDFDERGFLIKKFVNPRIKNPILISGLPGIGNVGKIAVDFIIDNLRAKEMLRIYSKYFPHSAFINEQNLVELPSISLFYKKIGNKAFFFLAGDVQPITENSCYDFCNLVLDLISQYNCKEIVTLGGIGLNSIPKKPKVYVTGNNHEHLKKFRNVSNDLYAKVGPIIGVTGILLGLGDLRGLKTTALLTETFGHPSFFGVKSSKEVLEVLNKTFKLNLNIKRLSNEIEEIEEEIRAKAKQLAELKKAQTNQLTKGLSYFG